MQLLHTLVASDFTIDSFPVANGVRQGGPILFTLYIDALLLDLGVGCFWDSFFVGAMQILSFTRTFPLHTEDFDSLL